MCVVAVWCCFFSVFAISVRVMRCCCCSVCFACVIGFVFVVLLFVCLWFNVCLLLFVFSCGFVLLPFWCAFGCGCCFFVVVCLRLLLSPVCFVIGAVCFCICYVWVGCVVVVVCVFVLLVWLG